MSIGFWQLGILILLFFPSLNDENLDKIGFWRATGNYLVVGISVMILFIGLIMIGFTSRKQGLHNLVSRTIHLKDK